jgi:lipopolysaccharide/colanic/teichoic acid biosynthesis glycosyltransferase
MRHEPIDGLATSGEIAERNSTTRGRRAALRNLERQTPEVDSRSWLVVEAPTGEVSCFGQVEAGRSIQTVAGGSSASRAVEDRRSDTLHARELFEFGRDVVTILDDHAPGYLVCKAVLDRVVALVLLVVLAPVLLVVAALIKLDSKGPVIFIQRRAGSQRVKYRGRRGWRLREFRVLKFRTMRNGSSEALHREAIQQFIAAGAAVSQPGLALKLGRDTRVTRMGRILRASSLDELPQLLNVVLGEMSLVGPRPVPVYEVPEYELDALERLAATPGLTGLAQVRGRSSLSFSQIVAHDVEYVRSRGLVLDMKILAGTLPAVLSAEGAG